MRKLTAFLAVAGVFSAATISAPQATPVPGFEPLYERVFTSCSLPSGNVPDCEAAINAYAGALVGAVELDTANQSFTEVRAEVFAVNAPDEQLQIDIDALFELLLPESGALAPAVSPV